MSTPYLSLHLVEITRETEDTATFHFQHPEARQIPSQPGQFLTLILPIDGKSVRRAYSLSSCAFEGPRLSVTVKRVTGGLVSNYLLDKAKVGDRVEALAPIGNFIIKTDPDVERHVVLFGAGSGITPLMSILKAVLKEEPKSKVYLIYGSRDEDNIIFKNQLAQLEEQHPERLNITHVLSQPKSIQQHASAGTPSRSFFSKLTDKLQLAGKTAPQPKPQDQEHTGRLNRSKVLKLVDKLGVANYSNSVYYICGPGTMMDEVKDALKMLRVAPERIFTELFVSKLETATTHGDVSTSPEDKTGAFEVTVLYEGAEYKYKVPPKQSILDAALDQDIDLPYSCQSGLCTACRGKCLSGKVHLDASDGLSDAELKEGYVLTCVGHPMTADVVIEIG